MTRPISTSTTIHGAPRIALASTGEGAPIELRFGPGMYPSIMIFTGSQDLTDDLADAINAVLAKHRAAAAINGAIEAHKEAVS